MKLHKKIRDKISCKRILLTQYQRVGLVEYENRAPIEIYMITFQKLDEVLIYF
jgi:hypothetical protein